MDPVTLILVLIAFLAGLLVGVFLGYLVVLVVVRKIWQDSGILELMRSLKPKTPLT